MNFSIKIILYNIFLSFFAPFVLKPANKIRFGITPDQSTNLSNGKIGYDANYTLYIDPQTYATPVVNDMNASYNECFKVTEAIRKQIKGNDAVVLTGVERWILDIPVPPPFRAHVKVPNIQPVVVCVFKSELMLKFICFDPTNPFRRAKPPGAFSVGVKTCMVAHGAPAPNIKDYAIQNPEKSTEFELLFTSDQVGKTLYIICYYINNRGEVGMDGAPYSVTII